LKRNLISR